MENVKKYMLSIGKNKNYSFLNYDKISKTYLLAMTDLAGMYEINPTPIKLYLQSLQANFRV